MIQAFHFGRAQRLFGAYHEPPRDVRARGGVVLCYPTAHEYIWAHRAFRQLAEQLAAAGLHVLRFDYFGAGDSSGESDEGSPVTWTENIATAVDELKDMTGLPSVSLTGLRIGATLAARAASARHDIDRLVLWDPIVSGATYLDEVVSLHTVLKAAADARPRAHSASTTREILGFPVTDRLANELRALRLEPGETRASNGVFIVTSEERAEYDALRTAPRAAVCDWVFRHIPGSGRWDQMDRVGTALLPRDIITATTAWLAAA